MSPFSTLRLTSWVLLTALFLSAPAWAQPRGTSETIINALTAGLCALIGALVGAFVFSKIKAQPTTSDSDLASIRQNLETIEPNLHRLVSSKDGNENNSKSANAELARLLAENMERARQLTSNQLQVQNDIQKQIASLSQIKKEFVDLHNNTLVRLKSSLPSAPVTSNPTPQTRTTLVPKFPQQPDQTLYVKWVEERIQKLEEIQQNLSGNARYYADELKTFGGQLSNCTEWFFSSEWSQQIEKYLSDVDRIVFAPLHFDGEVLVEPNMKDSHWHILHEIEVELRFYRRQLEKYLAQNGFERIQIELNRTKFDPYLHTDGPHDRLTTTDSNRDNVIVRVRENGFTKNGRVIRTAAVMREVLQEVPVNSYSERDSNIKYSSPLSDSIGATATSHSASNASSELSASDENALESGMTEIIPIRKRPESR